jgi:KaiC/GvpD/RAD55 family RecA-like ATPase
VSDPGKPAGEVSAAGRALVLTPASEITPVPVVWAWEDDDAGRIPAGSFGLFAGREGTGKSSFLIWKAAQITRGELPGAWKGIPRAVFYVAVEDSWKHTIVPRLMAAGADLTRVYRAEVETATSETVPETVTLSLPADNRLLEEAVREYDVALVAVDPLMSAISDSLDTHVNRQVRRALDPLAALADRTGAVIAGIAHFNKSTGTDASSLITASGAFKDVARYIFAFAVDDADGLHVITQTKNSLGRSGLPSLAYQITEATVETPTGDAKVGRFVLDGKTDRNVRDILAAQGASDDQRDELARAKVYLRTALAGGPRLTSEIEDEARERELIAKRTLERARRDEGVMARKAGLVWYIALPEHEGELSKLASKATEAAGRAKASRRTVMSAKTANPATRSGLGGLGGHDGTKTTKTAKTANLGGDGGDGAPPAAAGETR